jgi:hypothetical protein
MVRSLSRPLGSVSVTTRSPPESVAVSEEEMNGAALSTTSLPVPPMYEIEKSVPPIVKLDPSGSPMKAPPIGSLPSLSMRTSVWGEAGAGLPVVISDNDEPDKLTLPLTASWS